MLRRDFVQNGFPQAITRYNNSTNFDGKIHSDRLRQMGDNNNYL